MSDLLFVVHDHRRSAVWVFDNHDAALRCRTEQKLSWEALRGCVVFSDWKDGEPIHLSKAEQKR